jgi:L-cysteine/cystine lyase
LAYVDHLRRSFPALRNGTYLNTGSYGLLPETAFTAMQKSLAWQYQDGRARDTYDESLADAQSQVREALAQLLGADPRAFALTHSATHALNAMLWGIPFQPGDEVVVTDSEHPALYAILSHLRRRVGVTVRVLTTSGPDDVMLERAVRLFSPRTRLMVVSQVAWKSGRRFPVERLAGLAHEHGVWLAVDGAQGAGVDPVDLGGSEIDFYALCGHKWLMGPDGTGALYVRPVLWSVLEPVFTGTAGLRDGAAWSRDGFSLPAPDARRYELDRTQAAAWTGLAASLQFLRTHAGWEYVFTRSRTLSGELIGLLMEREAVEVITPRDARAGLVTVRVPRERVADLMELARARSIEVRVFPEEGWVRVSTAVYNSEEEVHRVVNLFF